MLRGNCLFSTLADFLIETNYVVADHGCVFFSPTSVQLSIKVKQPGEAANVQHLAIDFFLEGGWLPSKSVTASHLGSGNSTPAQCPTRNVITENMTSLHEFYTMYVYIYTQ